jgi:CRP-like cAMP-binding protein
MDSSAYFQYPSDTEGSDRFLRDLRDDEVRAVLSYTQARRYSRGEQAPSPTSVRAVDDSEVVVLSPTGFDRLRLAQPQLALRLVLHLARIVSLRFRKHERSLTAPGEL